VRRASFLLSILRKVGLEGEFGRRGMDWAIPGHGAAVGGIAPPGHAKAAESIVLRDSTHRWIGCMRLRLNPVRTTSGLRVSRRMRSGRPEPAINL
jgi:hypothetical protein